MKKSEELVVITKTYDLILWSCNHTGRFPRQHRFVLGERLERNLYDLLETLIQAKYSRDRKALSQFFANVYLDPLDHFVKERLQFKGYVRYVDDFLLFSDNKRHLAEAREPIKQFLCGLRLRLHPRKNTIFPVKEGIRFLGYRVFATHRLLVKENVWRFLRRVRRMQKDYSDGTTTLPDIRRRLISWSGHARQADTHRLRSHLFGKITFQRATAE